MLLFVDGFDTYETGVSESWLPGMWTTHLLNSNVDFNIDAGNGREGSDALRFNSTINTTSYLELHLPQNTNRITVGFAFYTPTPGGAGGQDYQFFSVGDDTETVHLILSFRTDGSVRVQRGDGTVLSASAASTVDFSTGWHYLEFQFTIDDSTGAYILMIDDGGSSGPVEIFNETGQDTRNGGNANVSMVRLGKVNAAAGATNSWRWDDFYILDDTGSKNTTFLGDTTIEPLIPDSDGFWADLTLSAGGSGAALVDDIPTDGDTTYVEGDSAGLKATFLKPDLIVSAGDVHAVAVGMNIRKTEAGIRRASTLIRSAGVDSNGATVTLSDDYHWVQQIFENRPGGAAWDVTSVNAMEFGMETKA